MAGELRVDNELLARAGAALTAIGGNLSDVTAATGLRTALGHDGLGDTLDGFARGWDDARVTTVRVVGELADACRHVAETFERHRPRPARRAHRPGPQHRALSRDHHGTSHVTTTSRRASTGTVDVVLPADWHVVGLSSDATRHADLTALADRQLPRRDDLASVRRRLRREVEDSSRRAARAGGRFTAYMLTAVGPLPLPAVLTAYRTPGSLAADEDLDALATTLAQRLGPAGAVDAGDGPLGPVLRAVTVRTTPADNGGTDLLVSDYWSDPDDDEGLLLLSSSTPLVPLRDAMLELCDTIAGSAHRPVNAGAGSRR